MDSVYNKLAKHLEYKLVVNKNTARISRVFLVVSDELDDEAILYDEARGLMYKVSIQNWENSGEYYNEYGEATAAALKCAKDLADRYSLVLAQLNEIGQ